MAEARDIVWISVPFTAGIAAGAVLCPHIFSSHPWAIHFSASVMAAVLAAALAAALRAGNRTPPRALKAAFAGIFLLTGLLCYLNSSMLEGIPYKEGPVARLAGRASVRLISCIDSIPFPSSTTGPLIKAILTGDRSSLGRETILTFRNSGASHILALSGLHLGVIYLLMLHLLKPLGNSRMARRLKCWSILLCSGFYAVMTGASPSIVRAWLFISINETGKLLGRERDAVGVLCSALTVQLAIKPDSITSIGFQLSYLAMAGIIFIYPGLERIYPEGRGGFLDRKNPLRKIWQGVSLSIACQATTAPLAWYCFRTFPRYFIVTNLVALPATSAIMVLSVATVALCAAGICPWELVLASDGAVQLLLRSLEVIASL